MSITRTVCGSLGFDAFGADSIGDYTCLPTAGPADWNISGGELHYPTAIVGDRQMKHASITTAKCVTAKVSNTYSGTRVGIVACAGAQDGATTLFLGYFSRQSTSYAQFFKRTAGLLTQLGIDYSGGLAATAWGHQRLYHDGSDINFLWGLSDLGDGSMSSPDATYTQGSGGADAFRQGDYDDLDLRTSHIVIGTGLGAGWYGQITDGISTPEKAAAAAGVATIPGGAILFSQSGYKYQVYDGDPDAGGNLIEEFTNAQCLADGFAKPGGGGDTYAYSVEAGGKPQIGSRLIGSPFIGGVLL